jgi:hypothetical protein
VSAIDRHQFLVELLFVVFIFLSDLRDLGLYFFHLLHGLVTLLCERPEDDFDHDGKQNDRHTVVMGIFEKPVEHMEERFGDKSEPAVVDGMGEVVSCLVQSIDFLGPHIHSELEILFFMGVQLEIVRQVDHLHEPRIGVQNTWDDLKTAFFHGNDGLKKIIVFITDPIHGGAQDDVLFEKILQGVIRERPFLKYGKLGKIVRTLFLQIGIGLNIKTDAHLIGQHGIGKVFQLNAKVHDV